MIVVAAAFVYLLGYAFIPSMIARALGQGDQKRTAELDDRIAIVWMKGAGGALVMFFGAYAIVVSMFKQNECFDPSIDERIFGILTGVFLLATGINHYRAHWKLEDEQ